MSHETRLREKVTIIITTSAIPSNPSTAVLDAVLESFHIVPELSECDIILTFDGYVVKVGDGDSKFKSMRINEEEVDKYNKYQLCARNSCMKHLGYVDSDIIKEYTTNSTISIGRRKRAESTLTTRNCTGKPQFTSIKFSKRLGFALAVREALKMVATPFILIHQHDWTYLRPVDMNMLCACMTEDPTVKYIGFSSRRSLRRISRPLLPLATPQKFSHCLLSPLYFWYDKPHLASAEHYRTFVYGKGRFQAGDFIEDTMGQAMLADLKASGVESHDAYGTWTFVHPHEPNRPTLKHRSGRHFRVNVYMRAPRLNEQNEITEAPFTGIEDGENDEESSTSDENDEDRLILG